MEQPVRSEPDGFLLRFLYRCAAGRCLLKLLCARPLSRLAGDFLDSPASRPLIGLFIRRFDISMDEYEAQEYRCFNDFFCRKIRAGRRPVDLQAKALIAPCDGLLSAYRIRQGTVIPVKQSRYTVKDLLGSDAVYRDYEDGICLVFRLCVHHYHRYCYIDTGVKGKNHAIPGKLHTVRPIALEAFPVFIENSREYTVIRTENFGRVIQMEVGAMLVGRIANNDPGRKNVRRGEEKGKFLYGGSTVIVLLKKDAARLPERFFRATQAGMEVPVKLGERIGTSFYK